MMMVMMMMMIGTSLCVFRKEEKHGSLLSPELGCESSAVNGEGSGCRFADSGCPQAPDVQPQAEGPSLHAQQQGA